MEPDFTRFSSFPILLILLRMADTDGRMGSEFPLMRLSPSCLLQARDFVLAERIIQAYTGVTEVIWRNPYFFNNMLIQEIE